MPAPDPAPTPTTHPQTAAQDSLPRSRKAARHLRPISLGTERQVFTPRNLLDDLTDPFHLAMTLSWPRFYLAIALGFVVLNLLFGTLYALQPGCIANVTPEGVWGYFFFSVETLATVGYGDMHPVTTYGHAISTLEIFTGMMGLALITGVTFARFSRPRSRIVAARYPVVMAYEGKPTLMFRVANSRRSLIVQATASLHVLLDNTSAEGHFMRRLYDLKLVRMVQPTFLLSWTLMHVIDESSPLFGMSAQALEEMHASFVLVLAGFDDTSQQDMRSRHVYHHADLRWNYCYEDLLWVDDLGREVVDFSSIDHIRPLAPDTTH